MSFGTVCLMYHELELPGRPLCQSEEGYVRYVVSLDNFRSHIKVLRDAGLTGISVSQMLDGKRGVTITFDDGCETDVLAAAPLLRDYGFSATFYITTGYVGTTGYLTRDQVRALAGSNCEIGCHSFTHPYLPDLRDADMLREIAGAKEALQQICGKSVDHFSCPGGRWSPKVAEMARESGYRSVATSRAGKNFTTTNPFHLARVAVMRDTTESQFLRLAQGRGLWPLQLRSHARSAIRTLVGNSTYDRMRMLLLKSKRGY
ncbi:MAG TPA: polysaccharide deacetylase family protein [Terriglobales bacterium]|jgi:peptidoglycan/xylan/chitin deacetylase (PgdA/CDA1 family)